MIEEWKPIPGFEGYEVSNTGYVRSWKPINQSAPPPIKPLIMQTHTTPRGYLTVSLYRGDKRKNLRVHRIVLAAFVSACPEGMEGAHLDGNPSNNRLDNLKWTTHTENNSHKKLHGTHQVGEKNGNSKLTAEDIAKIRGIEGRTQMSIAKEFNVSQVLVSKIRRGVIWKEVA